MKTPMDRFSEQCFSMHKIIGIVLKRKPVTIINPQYPLVTSYLLSLLYFFLLSICHYLTHYILYFTHAPLFSSCLSSWNLISRKAGSLSILFITVFPKSTKFLVYNKCPINMLNYYNSCLLRAVL